MSPKAFPSTGKGNLFLPVAQAQIPELSSLLPFLPYLHCQLHSQSWARIKLFHTTETLHSSQDFIFPCLNCDKIMTSDSGRKGFIMPPSVGRGAHPGEEGLAAGTPGSWPRSICSWGAKWRLALSSLPPFYSACDQSLRNGSAHRWVFPPHVNLILIDFHRYA